MKLSRFLLSSLLSQHVASFLPSSVRSWRRVASLTLPSLEASSVDDGASKDAAATSMTTSAVTITSIKFTEDEERVLRDLTPDSLKEKMATALTPTLMVKLRQAVDNTDAHVQALAVKLNQLLDQQYDVAKDTLQGLLHAGEIRKLDNLIGQAARDGRLDVAFFNVLHTNLQDAAANDQTSTTEESASRLQILQHVYTRCQEEVEKTIAPGTALLNKLLRTTEDSIRRNIYEHYLAPQASTITTPTGKTVDLDTQLPARIPLPDFVEAIATAVQQIRTLEMAGAVDRTTAAGMVENCRTVAKEARIIVGESYGVESNELLEFEDGLQPVFRPASADSVYVKGVE